MVLLTSCSLMSNNYNISRTNNLDIGDQEQLLFGVLNSGQYEFNYDGKYTIYIVHYLNGKIVDKLDVEDSQSDNQDSFKTKIAFTRNNEFTKTATFNLLDFNGSTLIRTYNLENDITTFKSYQQDALNVKSNSETIITGIYAGNYKNPTPKELKSKEALLLVFES